MDDPVYRTVTELREPGALRRGILAAWRREGADPDEAATFETIYTHYKPYTRARLLVVARIPREDRPGSVRTRYLSLQVYPTLEAAAARLQGLEKKSLLCWGPPVSLLEEFRTIAWSLPNGPSLRTIRIARSGKRFRRFLVRNGLLDDSFEGRVRPPRLVRYVPRKRATFRFRPIPECGNPGGYVKIYAPGLDGTPARNLEEIRRAYRADALAFRPPLLVAHDEQRRAIVMKRLKGRLLTDLFASSEAGVAAGVGRALASLHASSARPGTLWSPDTELRALRLAADDLGRALPALQDRIQSIVEELGARKAELVFPAALPIHANLFGDQILVSRSGRIGIVDWDDFSLGDPLYDLGRLTAHLVYAGRRCADPSAVDQFLVGMLAAYAQEGLPVDPVRLQWHIVTALILRAKISALRQLPDGWIDDVTATLRLAECFLSEGALSGDGRLAAMVSGLAR